MFDMQDDIFQAHCQITYLQDAIEEGAKVAKVEGDVVTLDLPDGSYTEINLRPVQHLLTELRALGH